MTELHYAVYLQGLERVKACVEQGNDVNQKDAKGWTALVWCLDMAATGEFGAAEVIIDCLLEHGRAQGSKTPNMLAFQSLLIRVTHLLRSIWSDGSTATSTQPSRRAWPMV